MHAMRGPAHRESRLGAALLVAGCVPLAIGAALPSADAEPGLWCPFRAATGLPCPLCGGTRAMIYAARGDGRLWEVNAPWAVLAGAAIVVGAAGLLFAVSGRAPLSRAADRLATALATPGRVVAAIALVAAGPWAWALAHAGTIA